jgi:adenine-specific DNA-methyltransferase
MTEFPITLEWKNPKRNIPKLNLQILETYLFTEDTQFQKKAMQKSVGDAKKIKRLVPTTLMQYLDLDIKNQEKREKIEDELYKDWKNLLIWGDNLYVLKSLQEKFQDLIQFVYIDPPFYTGANEYIDIPIGSGSKKTIQQMPTPIKDIAYRNIWAGPNHIESLSQWFHERAVLIHKLLKKTGFLAVRFDYHYGHYIKLILDKIFGESNYICEYLVRRMYKPVSNKALESQRHLIVQADSLFLYRKSPDAIFFEEIRKAKRKNADPIEYESNKDNIWIDIVGYEKTKKTLYPTENSISLLDRIIRQCSKTNDLIADFFCGSGTTVARAQELKRHWIAVDISRYSINEIRKRILLNSKSTEYPFQLLNLEMYNKHLLFLKLKKEQEHIAKVQRDYYNFILEKFGGILIEDFEHIHGKKNSSFIHIGDIDSIISPMEIQKSVEEMKVQDIHNLIILGWDYFMEVGFFKKLFQEDLQINVDLRVLPQSLISEDADYEHQFTKLPYLEFNQSINPRNRKIIIEFGKFISKYHTDLYKLELNDKQTLDLIDFWAVDWDYDENKLFRANDYSFRKIGSGRKIIESAATQIEHQYEKPGSYTIVLTVVDIFGNETCEYFQVLFT